MLIKINQSKYRFIKKEILNRLRSSYNTNLFKLRNKYAYIKSNEDDVLSLC